MPLARFSLILIVILLIIQSSFLSAPLTFVPIQLKQPDGTILNVFASGDEFYNWVHDKNNFTIILDPSNGYYVYAALQKGKLVPTKYIVGKDDPKSVGLVAGVNSFSDVSKKVSLAKIAYTEASSNSITAGARYNLVIFIRFKNEPEFTDSKSTYDNMLNNVNGPSLKHYYFETSNGQLDVSSNIFPAGALITSYQDIEERNYYLKYDVNTNPTGYKDNDKGTRENNLLRRALDFVAPQIPVSALLDGNNDGNIDNVIFIVSGSPAGWSDLIWPHMSSLGGTAYRINSKRVVNYNFQLQKSVSWSVLDHEMGHSLGMPDLYRYNNKTVTPVGSWDLMATNRVHMNNYMKWKYLKWISTIPEITENGNYWLNKSTSSTKNIYKIKSPRSLREYFILEYRVQNGLYESSLPGSGLIVYRINENVRGNADGPPDEIYIYRPNGTIATDGQLSLAHMGSNYGRTEINQSTNPYCFLSDSYDGGLRIKNIGIVGADSINFDVEIVKELTIKNDYTAEKTIYDWIDISQTGTVINNWMNAKAGKDSTLDDGYSSSAIPLGSDFTFYGKKFNSIYVGINGLISFEYQFLNVGTSSTTGSATNFGFFNSNVSWPGNLHFPNSIAVAYADLDLNTKDGYGGGKIMYQAFEDKFVLSWLNIGTFERKADTTNVFQLVLDKSSNSIIMNYKNFGIDDTRKIIKVGIQKEAMNGLSWLNSGDYVDRIPVNNSSVRFYPSAFSSQKEIFENIPAQFTLMQNFPNPFNPGTVINYNLAVSSNVTLKVFDVLGREVETLVDEFKSAGRYSVRFDLGTGSNASLSSGIYFYTLQAGSFIQTKKMIVLK
jgi:M6 family metalloprotease-like protein